MYGHALSVLLPRPLGHEFLDQTLDPVPNLVADWDGLELWPAGSSSAQSSYRFPV